MLGYFLLFTLAACSFPVNPEYDDCLDITGESPCSKTANCKWYGRLNSGGACVKEHGRNDPNADTCHGVTDQSSCSRTSGCKWYGSQTGKKPKCVTQGGINDPDRNGNPNRNQVKNPSRGFFNWFAGFR